MIIRLKPSYTHKNQAGKLGESSFVMDEGNRRYYWKGKGCLSIKSFSKGRAVYNTGAGRYAVDDGSYLILNRGRDYSIEIDSETRVGSFCIFFEDGFAEEVYRSLTAEPDRLLEDPNKSDLPQIDFVEKIYRHDDLLSPALFDLKSTLDEIKDDEGLLKERMHDLMERLLQARLRVYKEMESLPALRASTREELYKRLHRARDYVAACFDKPITLDDMSLAACLSPNHFLKTFKKVFRQTPHQYLIDLRLEHAKLLLDRTDQSVTDICFSIGFESLGSFSWLFRKRIGVSPERYRRKR